jgi:alkanesulfonate monooxygenase SsuD/methylene tetrahydromethanopterin reductase-like flavin-dependent oxidoreductase (luciferase family)
MFMAGLVHRTSLNFGTGVINLPNHHPAIVAAEVAQFDHMAQGRFMMGIGAGGLSSDFELFGDIEPKERGKRMVESLETIQRIWAAEPPYDVGGETWPVKISRNVLPKYGVGFMPKPFQPGGPSIHISARSKDSQGVALAAKRGWGVISANFVAHRILAAATDAEARARATAEEGATRYYFEYLGSLAKRAGLAATMTPREDMDHNTATAEDMIDACVIAGSPRTVLDKLIALREEAGPYGHVLMAGLDWSGPNAAWEAESMARLAQEVMPRLRQHLDRRAAAE